MNVSKIVEYFGILVALTFIGLGIFVLFTNIFDNLPTNYKLVFASLLIAYGGFRLVSIILRQKNKKYEESPED